MNKVGKGKSGRGKEGLVLVPLLAEKESEGLDLELERT